MNLLPSTVVVIKCADPGSLRNGRRTISSLNVGGTVTYYCNSGYRLVGDSSRRCTSDGRGGAYWSGSLPRCEGGRGVWVGSSCVQWVWSTVYRIWVQSSCEQHVGVACIEWVWSGYVLYGCGIR